MAYNYGTVSLASVASGLNLTVAATPSDGTGEIRAFDFCLLNTSTTVMFFDGFTTAGLTTANLMIRLDRNQVGFVSNVGIRFDGNIITSAGAVAGNVASVTYIREF